MKTIRIPQKRSSTGSIHDIASDSYDRIIKFRKGCHYAVILSSYYGDSYRTYQTADALIADKNYRGDYSCSIIDSCGNTYDINYDRLQLSY